MWSTYYNDVLTFPELSTPEKASLASCTTPLGSMRAVCVAGSTAAGKDSGTTGSTVNQTANTSETP